MIMINASNVKTSRNKKYKINISITRGYIRNQFTRQRRLTCIDYSVHELCSQLYIYGI